MEIKNKDLRRWCEDAISFANQVELSVSASQDNWLVADRLRAESYIAELGVLYTAAADRAELDQPLVNPRTYSIVEMKEGTEITNRDVRDFYESLQDLYDEVKESQSVSRSRGVHAADLIRYVANEADIKKHINDYVEPVIDKPELEG